MENEGTTLNVASKYI